MKLNLEGLKGNYLYRGFTKGEGNALSKEGVATTVYWGSALFIDFDARNGVSIGLFSLDYGDITEENAMGALSELRLSASIYLVDVLNNNTNIGAHIKQHKSRPNVRYSILYDKTKAIDEDLEREIRVYDYIQRKDGIWSVIEDIYKED